MSQKINIDELKVMIANKIKESGLNDVFDSAAIEKIKDKVMGKYNHEKAISEIPELIPEAVGTSPLNSTATGVFPGGGFGTGEPTGRTDMGDATSIETVHTPTDFTQTPGQNVDMSTTGNIPAYKPEIPSFLNKIEPAKVIIFSQNELSQGGENLSHTPLRTFENPDIKKSMNDFWLDKGQKKAEVYIAKLEKIGDLEFDFANGTTKFMEKRFDPDFEAQAKYKENPYMPTGPAAPGTLDMNGQPNIVNQIASSVDLQQIATNLVMDMLRDKLLTNETKAVSEISPTEPMGYNVSQAVKPMEESFNLKMIDLVNGYDKIDMPKTLKEAIESDNKLLLVKENEEVQEWVLDGKTYYTPVNKISIRKCYIKK